MLSIWLLCHALVSIDGQWMVMSLFGVGWLVNIATGIPVSIAVILISSCCVISITPSCYYIMHYCAIKCLQCCTNVHIDWHSFPYWEWRPPSCCSASRRASWLKSQAVPCDARLCSPAAPGDGFGVVGLLSRWKAVVARWLFRYTLGYAGSQVISYLRTRSARFQH